MNNLRQRKADSSRPHRLLNKAIVSALLAALAAAGLALLNPTPAAAQSVPSAPDLIWMNGGHAGGSGARRSRPTGRRLPHWTTRKSTSGATRTDDCCAPSVRPGLIHSSA